jgi:hypothetical protein
VRDNGKTVTRGGGTIDCHAPRQNHSIYKVRCFFFAYLLLIELASTLI